MNDSAIRDPTTANCRIYVGNLKENTPKNELNNIFSKYGTIRGIMVSRNFGFIQFDSEQSVNNAIDNENQKMYNGRKITVSKVQKKSNQKPSDKGNASGGPNEVSNQNPPNDTMLTSSGSDPMTKTLQINTNNNVNNNSNNNNNNNNGSNNNISNQNTGNNPRQNWMRNRNNNRNNNNNNEMKLHTDRERSPFDGRRDSNNERWSQDGGNSNLSNFRNNNRNNNMHRNNNMNNMSGNNTGNNAGSNASNSIGAIQGTIGMNSNNNKNSAGNVQTFSIK